MKKLVLIMLAMCTITGVSATTAFSQLLPAVVPNGVAVTGVRDSDIPWGLGPFNYVAGATMSTLVPTDEPGWVQAGINNWAGYTQFGAGTGWKAIFQFYQDADNVIAMGVIKDPGAAPWGGLTLMVEGLAYGQPIGGYWPQGYQGWYGGGYHSIFISWTNKQISFTIDGLPPLIYDINLASPSFSVMGCARMPGDLCSLVLELYDFNWRATTEVEPEFVLWTSDNAAGQITPTQRWTFPFNP